MDRRLMCEPVRVAYDFTTKQGELHMKEGQCCDMMGCIRIFENIDPKVELITTYSGEERKTVSVYRKAPMEKWVALRPQ